MGSRNNSGLNYPIQITDLISIRPPTIASSKRYKSPKLTVHQFYYLIKTTNLTEIIN